MPSRPEQDDQSAVGAEAPTADCGKRWSATKRTALGLSIIATAAGACLMAIQPRSGVRLSALEIGPEAPATAMRVPERPANNSPTLQADPTDDRFVVLANRVDAPEYRCSLQVSGDGGQSWLPVNPVVTLPATAEKCFGGEVAFDRMGTLYFLFVGLAGGGNEPMGAYLVTSMDRGRTFSDPRQVLGPFNFGIRMAIDLASGAIGRLHLLWLQSSSDPPAGGFGQGKNPIMTAYSDDGGLKFSEPLAVSDPGRQRVVAPALAIGAKGHVYAAYYDLQEDARDYQGLEGPVWDGSWSLVLARSRDGGRSFDSGIEVEPAVTPPSRVMAIYIMPPPALTVRRSSVCLAWADARAGDPDVFARCSGNAGGRWHPATRVNDDPPGTGLWQYLPALTIGRNNTVYALYLDRRADTQNLNNEVFYAFSNNGGRSFTPSRRLNREGSSLSVVGVQYTVASAAGQWDFGSRLALLARNDKVVAAWTDTRNSAPRTTGQDIFTTVMRRVGSRGSAAPALLAGGLLFLGGGVSSMMLLRKPRQR